MKRRETSNKMKRITIVTGHYGSGKTEFSLNLALKLACRGKKTALVDLDIANVYFRSRERQQLLEDNGVEVHSNAYHYDITADLPALSPSIRKPLEDVSYHTIIDVGGDHSGARILNQFSKYFGSNQTEMLCVINANRPETDTVEGALYHILSIQEETGLNADGLVNNTHLLRETKIEDILKGYQLCKSLSDKLKIPVTYNCCVEELCNQLEEKNKEQLDNFAVFPMKLYMRPSWLDR
jgi:hypothetical protein